MTVWRSGFRIEGVWLRDQGVMRGEATDTTQGHVSPSTLVYKEYRESYLTQYTSIRRETDHDAIVLLVDSEKERVVHHIHLIRD